MERQFHSNESSWNVRSGGTKVPQERKFQGANVPRNESSTGAKFLSVDFSLPGTKVQRNEKAPPGFLLTLPDPRGGVLTLSDSRGGILTLTDPRDNHFFEKGH